MCYKFFEAKYYMIRYVWCVLKVVCSEQLGDQEGSLSLKLQLSERLCHAHGHWIRFMKIVY